MAGFSFLARKLISPSVEVLLWICVCSILCPCLQCYAISLTSGFRFSICFSAGRCPGVEGEEITQCTQAEFSRTKTIWVKVTRWNSVGSAALHHHLTTKLAARRLKPAPFFSEKKPNEEERKEREGRISVKALNPFFPYPLAMQFIDGSLLEDLNNGFGQHLLRKHWKPWAHQTQLPNVLRMFCISNNSI